MPKKCILISQKVECPLFLFGAMPTLAVGMLRLSPRFPHAHGKRGHGTE
jgi:hypothetical protein